MFDLPAAVKAQFFLSHCEHTEATQCGGVKDKVMETDALR